MASEWSTRGILRLTTDRGIQLRGDSAWVAGDTLQFRVYAESTATLSRARVAGIERNAIDRGRTTALGMGVLILTVLGLVISDDLFAGDYGLGGLGSP